MENKNNLHKIEKYNYISEYVSCACTQLKANCLCLSQPLPVHPYLHPPPLLPHEWCHLWPCCTPPTIWLSWELCLGSCQFHHCPLLTWSCWGHHCVCLALSHCSCRCASGHRSLQSCSQKCCQYSYGTSNPHSNIQKQKAHSIVKHQTIKSIKMYIYYLFTLQAVW